MTRCHARPWGLWHAGLDGKPCLSLQVFPCGQLLPCRARHNPRLAAASINFSHGELPIPLGKVLLYLRWKSSCLLEHKSKHAGKRTDRPILSIRFG
ncbi:unnamed protein product [Urochloa humidicola]